MDRYVGRYYTQRDRHKRYKWIKTQLFPKVLIAGKKIREAYIKEHLAIVIDIKITVCTNYSNWKMTGLSSKLAKVVLVQAVFF